LWSPDNPQLYKCKVIIKEINERNKTEVEENFGLRFFDFKKDGPFYLNGKRLLLKGTHRHEDHAGVGAALSEETTEKEFNLIKDMGVNFIRLAHYQQSRKVLELCDKLGILVWEEIPWCRGGLGGEKYKKQAIRMLDSMITQHYNHPSIIIWGMGNENDWEADFDHFEENKIREFMKRLHQKSKKMDPSRKTAIRRCDFCKDIIDIYSPSIWAGWYGGVYKDYKQASRNEFEKVDHFLHVEWGADNLLGRYTENTYTGFEDIGENQKTAEEDGDYFLEGGKARVSRDGDWSENYFCDLIDWHLKEQESMEWLTGTAQWPFKDFSTPVRPENPIPYMNLKGVVDRDMRIKEGYYVFQSYWSSVPMIHIFGSRWDVRYGSLDEKKMVKVYSNCSEAELILNGVSLGKKQRNHKDFPAAGLRWNVQFKKGKNTIKVKGWKDSRLVVDSTTFDYQIDLWENPEKFELKLEKKDSEIYCLKVKAVDKNNVLCCDADNFVYFDITGEGELIANRGTVDGSKKVQLASGTAKIFINSQSGNFVASVSSDEIKTNFIAGKNYV
jgi:beta-galactosidase